MAKFKATAPDGSTWNVDTPDGMPPEQIAREVDSAFAARGPKKQDDALKQVAEETPEWERRAAAVGRSMAAPIEGLEQGREHAVGWLAEKIAGWLQNAVPQGSKTAPWERATGGTIQEKVKADVAKRLKGVDEEAALKDKAMEAIYKTSPVARGTGIATDIASGFVLPAARASEAAGLIGRIGAGSATGAAYGASMPVTSGEDFASEKAKQTGVGAVAGGVLTAAVEGVGRAAGGVSSLWDRAMGAVRGAVKPSEIGPVGEGAEKVTKALQDVRERIEAKVGGKARRASERAASVEADAAGGQTASAGEFGAIARGAMQARKAELEAVRDTEAMPLLDAALNSGAEVNISGIPKQIDLMLKNEKNPDIIRALLKAKSMMYAKASGEEVEQFAKFDLKTPEGKKALTDALEAAEGKKKLDTSVRGLDSARLAIKAMISGEGSEAADRFAKAQLGKVIDMLEQGISKAVPEYGEYLTKYRQLSKPLDQFSPASGTGRRAAAAVQKDKFEGDFMSSPESMGARFFKPGDEGAAAAREFKQAVGNDQSSTGAMSAYIAGKLKGVTPDKWGPFLKKHESALREFGLYEGMSGLERTAVSAKSGVERASATERNVAGIMKETALGKLTRDSQSFKAITGEDAQAAIEKVFSGRTPVIDLQQLVSMTRKNPEARDGLRQAFKDWLIKSDAAGEIKTEQMLTKWKSIKGAVEKSGLLDSEHVANLDAIMGELKKSYATEGIKRGVGNMVGWLVGGYRGAYAGRQLGGMAAKHAQQEIEQVVLQMASDPEKARILAGQQSAANIAQVKRWIDSDFALQLERAGAVDAGREGGERKTKKRSLQDAVDRSGIGAMSGVRG